MDTDRTSALKIEGESVHSEASLLLLQRGLRLA